MIWFTLCYFFAVVVFPNQGNHQNFDPTVLLYKFKLTFFHGNKAKRSMSFSFPQILNIFTYYCGFYHNVTPVTRLCMEYANTQANDSISIKLLCCIDAVKTFTKNWVSKQSSFVLILTRAWFSKLSKSVWKRISWNFRKFQFNQTTHRKNENNHRLNKLNKLKFCEVSQNLISNRC